MISQISVEEAICCLLVLVEEEDVVAVPAPGVPDADGGLRGAGEHQAPDHHHAVQVRRFRPRVQSGLVICVVSKPSRVPTRVWRSVQQLRSPKSQAWVAPNYVSFCWRLFMSWN